MATGQQGPPTRPWFRLATMVRPPPPPPPQPPSRPPTVIIRPSVVARAATEKKPPTSPAKTEQIPSSSSSSHTNTTTTISNPPSPLALPSPQLKYSTDQQLPQETKVDNNNNRHLDKKTKNKQQQQQPEDVGNGMTRRIIIAGENKGAIMDLRNPSGKQMISTDEDDSSVWYAGGSSHKSAYASADHSDNSNSNDIKPPLIMNSNVQGVINSILYNSSTTHHDPGLHLSLSRN